MIEAFENADFDDGLRISLALTAMFRSQPDMLSNLALSNPACLVVATKTVEIVAQHLAESKRTAAKILWLTALLDKGECERRMSLLPDGIKSHTVVATEAKSALLAMQKSNQLRQQTSWQWRGCSRARSWA